MQNERTEDDRMAEFEAAALPHMKDLFRTAVALLRNRTEAEDVVQELYLQAWKSFHRFTPGTNCRDDLSRARQSWSEQVSRRHNLEPQISRQLHYCPAAPAIIRPGLKGAAS